MRGRKEEERYFQTIARRFYHLRGAPFFLSSKELSFIENWRKQDIPLAVVLEGIKLAYETFKRRPHRKGRTFSLGFCHGHVIKSFGQHKERKIGKRRTPALPDKRAKVKAECEGFLRRIPDQVAYLQEVFARILEEFSEGKIEENRLEQYEQEIETLIVAKASFHEKEGATKEVQAEYHVFNQQEGNRIIHIRLLKNIREKYRIPHVSLFYY